MSNTVGQTVEDKIELFNFHQLSSCFVLLIGGWKEVGEYKMPNGTFQNVPLYQWK